MLTIQPEEPSQVGAIYALHAACFPSEDEARLVDALRQAGNLTVSLVALERGVVVGHVAFSPVRVPGAAEGAGAGLAPIAVLPNHRRQGVGDHLVREGLKACEHAGFGFVVLLGNPRYYRRFGFELATVWGLTNEYGVQDGFMAIELRHGSIPAGGGLARYAPEFAVLT